jgi:menaquinone-dependent protoporphyrinogen oxidase
MAAKTLVVYYSKGGATEDYARIVAQVLGSGGHEVELVNLRNRVKLNLADYDNVVVGTGVRIGMVYRKGKRFLRRKQLKGKRLAIFLSSGIAVEDAEKSKRKFLTPLVEKYGLDPVAYDALPGKVPGPGGELENKTDPGRARLWAEDLVAKLHEAN